MRWAVFVVMSVILDVFVGMWEALCMCEEFKCNQCICRHVGGAVYLR